MFQEFAGWWFRGFCSQMMGNQTLSWCQIKLHHWFLEKLCLVVLSADHPQLVIVGFVFPLLLPHFLNQNKFQMAIALFHPKQSGTGYIFTPLVRESLCHRSWSWAADYFQIWFYSLTQKLFLFLSVCVKSVLYSFTNLKNSCEFFFFFCLHPLLFHGEILCTYFCEYAPLTSHILWAIQLPWGHLFLWIK